MIDWADVTPVIVTRGDVDLGAIVAGLPFSHVVIWNNGDGSRQDLSVYGRYAAIADTASSVIYVQDDDVLLHPDSFAALLAAYQRGKIVANMPAEYRERYTDSCLLGFGAIFDRSLPAQAFSEFVERDVWGISDPVFWRTCDIVFTTLTPFTLVDLPFTMLPWTHAPNRMYRQEGNTLERKRMLELCRQARDRGKTALAHG